MSTDVLSTDACVVPRDGPGLGGSTRVDENTVLVLDLCTDRIR